MADRLRELGFAVDDRHARPSPRRRQVIGRPHLAEAVVSHPDNRGRLEREGLTTVDTFLPAYLIPGRPGYCHARPLTVEEAIAWVHDARGVAVWAHPFWDIERPRSCLRRLIASGWGLDGIECFYPTHSRAQTDLLVVECERRGPADNGFGRFPRP